MADLATTLQQRRNEIDSARRERIRKAIKVYTINMPHGKRHRVELDLPLAYIMMETTDDYMVNVRISVNAGVDNLYGLGGMLESDEDSANQNGEAFDVVHETISDLPFMIGHVRSLFNKVMEEMEQQDAADRKAERDASDAERAAKLSNLNW